MNAKGLIIAGTAALLFASGAYAASEAQDNAQAAAQATGNGVAMTKNANGCSGKTCKSKTCKGKMSCKGSNGKMKCKSKMKCTSKMSCKSAQ